MSQFNNKTTIAFKGGVYIEESASQTADQNYDFDGQGLNGTHIVIDITAAGTPATDTIIFTVQGFDEASGKYYDILESAALDVVGTTVLKVFPSAPVVANVSENDRIPNSFRVKTTKNTAVSFTYSIGVDLS